jgi:hypothetical protein
MLAQCTAKLNSKLNIVVLIMHSEHPNISKHKKHCDCSLYLGFDLAVVDVVGEQKTVLT